MIHAWRGGWSRKEVVDGGDPLETGAVLDECVPVLQELGGSDLLQDVRGQGGPRELVPRGQDELLYGLQSLFGRVRMPALPALLCSDEASRRVVGFNAHHVRHGVGQRGAATRPGPRLSGPVGPEALAHNLVKLDLRALEAWFNGAIRAVAKAGLFRATVPGLVDGTDLETTAPYEGCGHVTRQQQIPEKRGRVHASAVTV